MLSGLSVDLGQVQDVSPPLLAVLIFAIFSTAFAAPLVRRALGARHAYLGLAAALALLRLAEQFTFNLDARLLIAIVGVIIWLWFIPLLFRHDSGDGSRSATTGVLALVVGLTVDTTLKGAFATLDLASAPGLAPQLTTVALAAVQLLLVIRLARTSDPERSADPGPRSLFVIGPAIALSLLIFQNLAHFAATIGWSLPAVFAWTTLANLIAIWLTLGWGRAVPVPSRWMTVAAAVALIVMLAPTPPAWLAALAALLGPAALATLLLASLASSDGRPRWPTMPLGLIAIPIVLFGWYAHYEIDIPIPQWIIPLAAGAVIAAPALTSARSVPLSVWPKARFVGVGTLLLLLLPFHQFLTWDDPEPQPTTGQLRVVTYNIHQGFDLYGRHDLEGIAQTLEHSQAQIVALQEVPRGWVVNGSVDALSWLARRLRMHAAWGPAADPNWGNAILSRHPIVDFDNRPMPNNDDLLFDRAYMVATIDLGDRQVQVVATHLHHIERDSHHRLPQVQALLEEIDWSRPTILLGDLNAQPHHREIRLLTSAGLSTAQPPVASYPADRPRRQIDYVMTTPHFTIIDIHAPPTTASDHLPLVATLE